MQVINPIYDSAFKYLMDDNKVAKLFISAIIGEEIEELTMDVTELKTQVPKESIIEKGDGATSVHSFLSLLRIDFAARIKTASGDYKEVLIEIQKAKLPNDIMRFRSYLGERYSNPNVSVKVKGVVKVLPILPIFFLGHPLDHCDASVIQVARRYIDVITGQEIKKKEYFIESLTHDGFVIQISQLKNRRRNDLEILLSVFDQSKSLDDKHILDIEEVDLPEKYRIVLRRLKQAVSDKKIRSAMKMEDEVLDELKSLETEILKERTEKEEAQKKEAKALALAEKEKAEKEKEKAEKEKERAEKEKALKLAESNRAALAQTAKLLLSMNVSKADIAKNIGITSSELEDLLS
jgi:hypothetical protein